ncbi:MAG TPA: ATP-binding cassette domain-containing protein [Candidatus Polarisedimenticolia bacterium]|nr:ATP-binding cassette domain-containing protein [Candidatus Polarisedimenticolia bacterium]
MNALELKGVSKSYDGHQALAPLDLTVGEGRVCGLLGPNGAGKTTTIRMITGILLPDVGDVVLFGEKFRQDLRRRIGYLPEEHGLYPKMIVREHLEFLAGLQGIASARRAAAVKGWLDRLGLSQWAGRKVEELSKGMQQKVQFIATVLHEPDLLVLDEPFSGLDPVNTKLLKDIILEFVRGGKTVILSTHRMEQVEMMCDDICLIDRGRQVVHGQLGEIRRRYGHNSVRVEFEGDTGFLDGLKGVSRVDRYANYAEVQLKDGAEPQILFDALAGKVRVRRFEVGEPSINDIFIELTGKSGSVEASS